MKFDYDVPSIFQDTIICIINQQRKRFLLGLQNIQKGHYTGGDIHHPEHWGGGGGGEDLNQKRIIYLSVKVGKVFCLMKFDEDDIDN